MFKCSEVVFTVSLSCPQVTCPSWCFYHFLLHRDEWRWSRLCLKALFLPAALLKCCAWERTRSPDTGIPRNPNQRAILSIRHQNHNIYFVYLVLCEGFCSDTELVCIHRNCQFRRTNDATQKALKYWLMNSLGHDTSLLWLLLLGSPSFLLEVQLCLLEDSSTSSGAMLAKPHPSTVPIA